MTEINPLCDRVLPDCPGLTMSSGMYTSECGVCVDKGATEERALYVRRVKRCLSGTHVQKWSIQNELGK